MFQGLSNFASLLKNAQQLQGRAQEMRERLSQLRVQATAGGGMVRVEATGDQQIALVTIEQSLIQSGDRELIEDLVRAAVNQALEQSREAAAQEMSTLADGLGIPGLEEMLSKLHVVT